MSLQYNQETKELFPDDVNNLQKFEVNLEKVQKIKIVFVESSDFYGRITLYKLDILGSSGMFKNTGKVAYVYVITFLKNAYLFYLFLLNSNLVIPYIITWKNRSHW